MTRKNCATIIRMLRSFLVWANRCIEYSFYCLFFLVPLVIVNDTFELFEFNKMWITFGFTIVIVCLWLSKMIVSKRVLFQRTPLDIPILLFLISQIISTVFSMDPHVSFWGYYSRFNGGLLSTITYILLYYAFVSNFSRQEAPSIQTAATTTKQLTTYLPQPLDAVRLVKRLLFVSIGTALLVALWGLPSHFGYDPTCLMFRGTLDVGCWTEAFKPTIRMFSTLGQPDWLAAYLAILIPITIGVFPLLVPSFFTETNVLQKKWTTALILGLAALFFVDLSFTDSRSGYLGFAVAFGLFLSLAYVFAGLAKKKIALFFGLFLVPFFLMFFFVNQPFGQLEFLTFNGLKGKIATVTSPKAPQKPQPTTPAPKTFAGELGGTDSVKIRSIVWKGALDGWKENWLFGTGVETFAFAYYKYRPAAHNLTSEWDYLYNKAHNEYLNYLTTTGIVGLGTHVLMIGVFLFIVAHFLLRKRTTVPQETVFLVLALIAAYISIILTNFAGFSVVIVNLYFYLIPAWVLLLLGKIQPASYFSQTETKTTEDVGLFRWLMVFLVGFIGIYYIIVLYQYWEADKAYALGYNRDRVNQYDQAYADLRRAIELRGDEPVFKDELSINNAVLAGSYAYQKDMENANKLAQQAIVISNTVTTDYPNNVVFWKTRVRMLYILSQLDPKFLPEALRSIEKAHSLAPTDAKIAYNLGLLYGQNNKKEKAVEVLEKTVAMKPDYRDAWYALGLYARELAVNNEGKVVRPEMQKKASDAMHFILEHISAVETEPRKNLDAWGEK